MDIGTIKAGEDFYEVIDRSVRACEVLIAIIGKQWLTISDGDERRLDNSNDLVRLEIAKALSRDILVIPVLVQGATIPHPKDLPDELAALSRLQRCEITDTRWIYDVQQLIKRLKQVSPKLEVPWQKILIAAGCIIGISLLILVVFNSLRPITSANTNTNVVNSQIVENDANSKAANNVSTRGIVGRETSTKPMHTYIRGPKGGCYYISNSGLKVYGARSLCE